MKPEIIVAQLSIVDGAWQESPDNIALFDEASLFEGSLERGSLCVVAEVMGEAEGRDALARELIETARREYAASRGSITLALIQAVRAANDFFYTTNVNTSPEARRIAGMTAAVLRDAELFIAQAGAGMTCLVHGDDCQCLPEGSPWFQSDDNALQDWLASRSFSTPGAVPMGMRRNYTPDQFHITLQPGDIVVLATRTLAHLLTKEELIDTLAHRHPDEIIAGLEDLAGAADLSVIVLQIANEVAATSPVTPPADTVPAEQPTESPIFAPLPVEEVDLEITRPVMPHYEEQAPAIEAPVEEQTEEQYASEIESDAAVEQEPAEPSEEELALERARAEREAERKRIAEEQARVRREKLRATVFAGTAGIVGAMAGLLGKIDWTGIGKAADRAISFILGSIISIFVFILRALVPGQPTEGIPHPARPKRQTAWKLASFALPVLLIAAGTGMWVNYRAEVQRTQAAQLQNLIDQSNAAYEDSKRATDKNASSKLAQDALNLAQKAIDINSGSQKARTALNNAQEQIDILNGISVLFVQPTFAAYTDSKADPSRIVPHYPDLFVLDRGTQRIYRYTITDTGATPTPADGVILKTGDKVGDRVVGQLIDIMWVDAGRLVALDRNGAFLQFDPKAADPTKAWSARGASDPAAWSRVNLAASYGGNLYLVDAPRNQILKYVATVEGVWTSSVTYFVPGVTPDLSNVIDIAIDGDVYLLRGDGSIMRYTSGKPNDLAIKDLETPLAKPTSFYTSQTLASLYIADPGNQRIVQIDKTTGKFAKQFKPRGDRELFKSLKALTVDENKKLFFFISGNQAYMANIPQ